MRVQSSDIFTQRVSELMRRNYLTKAEMAKRLNVDYSTFWRKLNGQRNVDMVLLKKIAEILGTSTAYLTGETDISSVIPQKSEEQSGYTTNYAYWGGVVDNARELTESNDKDAMSYVYHMLSKALSLLSAKMETKSPQLLPTEKPSVINKPIIVGDNNESNLNLVPA